jgi:hypothetical protein
MYFLAGPAEELESDLEGRALDISLDIREAKSMIAVGWKDCSIEVGGDMVEKMFRFGRGDCILKRAILDRSNPDSLLGANIFPSDNDFALIFLWRRQTKIQGHLQIIRRSLP